MIAQDYRGIKFMEAFRFFGTPRANTFIGQVTDLPIHMHDGIELMYVLKGELHIKISFNRHKLQAGDFLIVNAYEVHSLQSEEKAEILFLQMDGELFEETEFAFDPHFYENYNQEAVKEVKEKIARIYLSQKEGKPAEEIEQFVKEIASLCDSFFQIHQYDVIHRAHMDFSPKQAAGARVQNVYQLLYSYYDEKLRLSDVAHMEHVDMSYISRLLKVGMGAGFQDTLNIIRTDRAEVFLLGTDLPVQQVGEKVGFSSHAYFVKHFKSHFGMAPAAYRQKYRNQIYPQKKMELRLISYSRTELIERIRTLESGRKKQSEEQYMEELCYEADYLIRLCSDIRGEEAKLENDRLLLHKRNGKLELLLKGRNTRIQIIQDAGQGNGTSGSLKSQNHT